MIFKRVRRRLTVVNAIVMATIVALLGAGIVLLDHRPHNSPPRACDRGFDQGESRGWDRFVDPKPAGQS